MRLIANTLVLPFQVAVTTVLYIDLRVRKEGFDVQLLTHSLEPAAGVTWRRLAVGLLTACARRRGGSAARERIDGATYLRLVKAADGRRAALPPAWRDCRRRPARRTATS